MSECKGEKNLMRADRYNIGDNYYINIDHIKIYVDHDNKRGKIIDTNNISIQTIKKIIYYLSKQSVDKIICYCDIKVFGIFIKAGFEVEGKIEGYFRGEDAFCMSYFISDERRICNDFSEKDSIIKKCLDIKNTFINVINTDFKYCIRNATEGDIQEMIKLFSIVFSTYPSPIYDEDFLRQTMNRKVLYKLAVHDGKIIGVASADMNKENLNAEITDCATHPDYRGKGILSSIIYSLEIDLKKKGFITLYSLSRAINPSINFVLSKHNYKFTGRMIENCNICGAFEDMNIWVKNINTFSKDNI